MSGKLVDADALSHRAAGNLLHDALFCCGKVYADWDQMAPPRLLWNVFKAIKNTIALVPRIAVASD